MDVRRSGMKKKGLARKKALQTWELINPEGVVSVESMSLNRHPRELGSPGSLPVSRQIEAFS